jgi:hypothetical protein
MLTPVIRTILIIGLTIPSPQASPRAVAAATQHPGSVPVAESHRPSIVIESPAPDSTLRGPAIVGFRTENIRMASVFAAASPDPGSIPSGHLHVKVDSAPWHWVHATADPVVISALPPGTHTVRLELADKNHQPLDVQTVTFTIAAPPIQ